MFKSFFGFAIFLSMFFLVGCGDLSKSIKIVEEINNAKTIEVIPVQPIETENDSSPIVLEIPEYLATWISVGENKAELQYNLVLEIPAAWRKFGEVKVWSERAGYGWNTRNENEPFYEVNGELYTIVIESPGKVGEMIFAIMSIPKENKNYSGIPKTDKYLGDYENQSYFAEFITEDQNLLKDIPGILNTLEFRVVNK